jgi:hypothetical protein
LCYRRAILGEKTVRKPTREPTRKPTRPPTRKAVERSIRRIEREEGAGWPPAEYEAGEGRTLQYLAKRFSDAGFEVVHQPEEGGAAYPDLIVRRDVLGRYNTYVIELQFARDPEELEPHIDRLERYASRSRRETVEEYWFVSNLSLRPGAQRPEMSHRIRLLTLKELEVWLDQLVPQPPPVPKAGKARTKIGKAIEANEAAINLAISGLILQIDDKLEGLRQERPNSDDAIASRDKRISDYERMRAELENIRTMVAAFTKGQAKEKEVVKSVTTFRDGVQNWWSRGHEAIISKTFDAGLFLSPIGILSLLKADLKTGMIVSGTLIAGKSIAGGMKGLKKKLFGD